MRELIQEAIAGCATLDQVRDGLTSLLRKGREERGWMRVGLVSGVINSDGQEAVEQNIQTMIRYAEMLRNFLDFPIFCTPDVFAEVWERLEERKLSFDQREEQFRLFWRGILSSGCVTDLFMTPRWEASIGAKDEHETAQSLEITIHYIEEPSHI